MKATYIFAIVIIAALGNAHAAGGPLDPDCTAKKAAKSTAAKATVGVGGRCDTAEAVKDTAADATEIDDKLKRDDDGPLEKTKDKVTDKDDEDDKNAGRKAVKAVAKD